MSHQTTGPYEGRNLEHIAFPMGGMGAGMICLSGTGALQDASLRHRPAIGNRVEQFSAICIKKESGNIARVLEGPIPDRLYFNNFDGRRDGDMGLPRFRHCTFTQQFPFATVSLSDPALPLRAEICGWSPFIPSDDEASSLPVACLEFRFENTSSEAIDAVYSFNSRNFMQIPRHWRTPKDAYGPARIRGLENSVIFEQDGKPERPWDEGRLCAKIISHQAAVNPAWFRGGWFDPQSMAWKAVEQGLAENKADITDGDPSPGATLAVPLHLAAGETQTVTLLLSWYVPYSEEAFHHGEGACAEGDDCCCADPQKNHRPWYATRFADLESLNDFWHTQHAELRRRCAAFSEHLFASDLPPASLEAISANLAILKSPTILRQHDGRIWGWEGCRSDSGCCPGSCTHVWNYAQAIPHLFPALERGLRETEFTIAQYEDGRQIFRVPLPIRPGNPEEKGWAGKMPAADGQLGGIIKIYRDWRISGDTDWLRTLWPSVKSSMTFCIEAWDPQRLGVLREPHHNTYDIEFWGADGMCTSFYLAALHAMSLMAPAVGDDPQEWQELCQAGTAYLEEKLYNGAYFFQQVEWENLRAPDPTQAYSELTSYSPEAQELLQVEGPKYQYKKGCLSDGILGYWMAACAGYQAPGDPAKTLSHLRAVFEHNFKADLSAHANPQRPQYAMGSEGGLLLCSWPDGDAPSLPFVYSNEVWTGIEYQVASHLIMHGETDKGESIVKACRARYDGQRRNPFNEVECGHFYARALASYALLQAYSGIRYDAIDKTLTINPKTKGDCRFFFAADGAWGSIGIQNGKPFIDLAEGELPIDHIHHS